MKQEVRNMLENTYQVFNDYLHKPLEAWDRFLEFLAVDQDFSLLLQLNHRFEWLFEDSELTNKIMSVYDPVLLRSDYHDHLGGIYTGMPDLSGLVNTNGNLLPMEVAQEVVRRSVPETQSKLNILDENAGSGRLLMAAYKRAPQAGLYGVEPDIRLLRIAFTNFAIHGIKGYLLNADTSVHAIDPVTEAGRHNWRYANSWYSCSDELRNREDSASRTN